MHTMLSSLIKVTVALAATFTGASARVQGGFCGDNGLDGITGTVPACMFEAGTTVFPHSTTADRWKVSDYLNVLV